MESNIKIHEVCKEIKMLDKSAVGIERVKQACISTRDSKEENQVKERADPVKYAEDSIYKGADNAIRETSRQAEKQVVRVGEMAWRYHKALQKPKSSVSCLADTDTPLHQPKEQMEKKAAQSQVKKRKIIKKAGSKENKQTIKTLDKGKKTIKEAKTIKTAKEAADKTVKTAERAGQSVQSTAKAVVKAAEKMAKAAKKSAQAAKEAAKKTAAAVKAIYIAVKNLITILAVMGWTAVIILLIVTLFGALMCMMGDGSTNEAISVSAEVEAYEPVIQKYAEENGISEYTELIKAVMMQESGGRGSAPMQCSESGSNTKYPRKPNGITDPEYSIECGVQELKACFQAARVESPIDMERISLALQGYNFGRGYITWAQDNYGGYTIVNAAEFSDKVAERLGWDNYGDKQYVPHVLRYYVFGRG